MKKTLWIVAVLLCALTLAWCNCNCDCNNSEEEMNEAMQFCLDNWGTHSIIHSQTAVYGECSFPSGIGCEDDLILDGGCDFEPNLDSIDTEEKRFAGCEESVIWWFNDMMTDDEYIDTQREDEQQMVDEEWNLTIISRGFKAKYNRDGYQWILPWLCEADFVQWGIMTSFDQEYMDA